MDYLGENNYMIIISILFFFENIRKYELNGFQFEFIYSLSKFK